MRVTDDLLVHAQSQDIWTLGDCILYDVCANHPRHGDPQEVTAKVWLIGRAYSAAIERRAKVDANADSVYEDRVVPKLTSSDIDARLEELRKFDRLDDRSLPPVLHAHNYLTQLFREISGLANRSLASKYLHFHMPSLFLLYDSRAALGLRLLRPRCRTTRCPAGAFDGEYAPFASKVLDLLDDIDAERGVRLTPRQIDRVLLKVADDHIRAKARVRT